ncbi:MAG: response regulator transcription factor [Pseudonocardiaceae bacterium]
MARAPLTELDLSYHADGLPDRNSYLTVTSAYLSEALPGDLRAWRGVDLVNPSVKMWFSEANAYRMPDVVDAVITEHPVVAHQLAYPDSEPVLRGSDRVSDRVFRSSRVYRELFLPVEARYQLTIGTDGNDTVTSGWIIKRSVRDFTEKELQHARRLQPLLALLDITYSSSPIRRTHSARIDEARKCAHLTVRELEILTRIADGLSAQQIARINRISVRTVRKNLENLYAKLECHDRLLAVNKARSLGLLRSPQETLERERRQNEPPCDSSCYRCLETG